MTCAAFLVADKRQRRSPSDQSVRFQRERERIAASGQAGVEAGVGFGEAFDAHAQVLDKAGLGKHRLNACGYSLGTTFAPNWMDWPMLFHGNPVAFEPGMVIFCHMIIFDSENGLAMTLGETVLVSEAGHERLSRSPLEFVVK